MSILKTCLFLLYVFVEIHYLSEISRIQINLKLSIDGLVSLEIADIEHLYQD